MKSNMPKYQISGETSEQDEITTSRMMAVKSLIEQGVTDPQQLVEFLNYDDNGQEIGDFSLEEVESYLEELQGGSESEEEDYYPEEEEEEEAAEEEPTEEEEEEMRYGGTPRYNDGGTYIGFGWKPLQAKTGMSVKSSTPNKAKAYRDTQSYTDFLKESFTDGIKNMTTSALQIQNAKKMGIPVKDPLEKAVYKKGGTFMKFQARNSQAADTPVANGIAAAGAGLAAIGAGLVSSNPFDQKQFDSYMDAYIKAHPDSFHRTSNDDAYFNDPEYIKNHSKGFITNQSYNSPFFLNSNRNNGYGWGYPDGNYIYRNGIPAYYENRGGYGYGMGGYDPLSFLQGIDPRGFKNYKHSGFRMPYFSRYSTSFDYYDPSQGTNYGTDYNKTNMSSSSQSGQNMNQGDNQQRQFKGYNMFKDLADNIRERRDARRANRNAGDQGGGMDEQQKLPFFKRLIYGKNTPGFVTDPNNPNYEISDQYDPNDPNNKNKALRSERVPFWKRKERRDRQVQRDLDVGPEVEVDEEQYMYGGNYRKPLKRYQVMGPNEQSNSEKPYAFADVDKNGLPDYLQTDLNQNPNPKRFNITDTEFDGNRLYYDIQNSGNDLIRRMDDAERWRNQLQDIQGLNAYNVFGNAGDKAGIRGDYTQLGILRPDEYIPQQFKGRPMSEYSRLGPRIGQTGFEFFDESELGPEELGGEFTYMTDDQIEEFKRNGGELEIY